MQRYRTAFFAMLAMTILLAGAVGLLWFDPKGVRARISSASSEQPSVSPNSPQGAETPPSGSNPSEPSLVPVTLTPQRMQSIGVKTGAVEYRQVHDEIQTTGNVEADETRLAEVQVRFAGWIQKVFVDSIFKQVQKGQRLLTIYSPELVRTENEYLLARSGHSFIFCDGATEAMGNSRARDC